MDRVPISSDFHTDGKQTASFFNLRIRWEGEKRIVGNPQLSSWLNRNMDENRHMSSDAEATT